MNKLIYQAFLNNDTLEEERLRALYPYLGPMSEIDIKKSLELIPEVFRKIIYDFVEKDMFDETIDLKCLKCDYEELGVEYEFIEECWFDGPYPILHL